mmetsp:Transcript_25275/g.31148  ORF Transcript_25275/g.31148 Transcript_25275/m.31148 type:complete len:262 (-) Transcript_25275:68-853(-)
MNFHCLIVAFVCCMYPTSAYTIHCFQSRAHLQRTYFRGRKLFLRRGGKESSPVTGYVPDGLTADEYAKIKKAELEKNESMNFAAWGPRFARSGRPDGDWMVMSSLWTGGFNSNRSQNSDQLGRSTRSVENGSKSIYVGRIVYAVKKYAPLYAFALLFLEMAASTAHFCKIIKPQSSFIAVTLHQMKAYGTMKSVSLAVIMRATILKGFLAGLLIKPFDLLIEECNRKLLWSPRKTMTLSSAVLTLLILLFSMIKACTFKYG